MPKLIAQTLIPMAWLNVDGNLGIVLDTYLYKIEMS